METGLVHITEDRVRQLLDWDSTVNVVEGALVAVSKKRVIQKPRTFTNVLGTDNLMLCMPGYLENETKKTLACKIVTAFPENRKRNPPLPNILANIFLFDEETGNMKCVIQGTEITTWRTAAASVVGTKYLHLRHPDRKNNILAIFGAGTQGRIHAIAFHHFFKFKEIRIWNRTAEKAVKLAQELQAMGIPARPFESGEEAAFHADVIVTATFATSPIVRFDWLKTSTHINAVGAGTVHYSELDEAIYKNSVIYVDHMESAKVELKGIEDMGVKLQAELGEVIIKNQAMPEKDKITIFHSMGMAVEDAAVGQLIYERHIKEK